MDGEIYVWHYIYLLDCICTALYYCSTWFDLNPLHSIPWLYFPLLDSTTLYHGSTGFYLALLHFSYPQLHPIMVLLGSTWLFSTLPFLYLTLFDSTTLYQGSTWLSLTLVHSTMALLGSTWLYYTLPWLLLALVDSSALYHGSTWIYLTLLYSTMAIPVSIWHTNMIRLGYT